MSDTQLKPIRIARPMIDVGDALKEALGDAVGMIEYPTNPAVMLLILRDGRKITLTAATIAGEAVTYLYF